MSIDQLFNKARKKGLSDFWSNYGYDENCGKHKELLANAKEKLRNTLTKTNDEPDYDDSFIVDAYLDIYHPQHCRLAYWVFKYLFNQFDVPNALYVCDVGAGTQAGCVGLALALSEYREEPAVYFDAYEPKNKMRKAGYCFWSAFQDSVGANFDPHTRSTLPHRLPDDLPANALRVVTAFHLSLPYNNRWNENNIGEKAQNSLEKAFRLVSPEYGFFTCHKDKEDSLRQAVDNSYVWKKEKGSRPYIPHRITPYLSSDTPDSIFSPTDSTSLPTDSILLLREAARHKPDKQKKLKRERLERGQSEEVETKRKVDEQEKLKREQSEKQPMSYPASSQREEKERLEWEKLERRWSEEKAERYRRALRLLQPLS